MIWEREERGQAEAVAGAVGHLPLALELAAAQVADGIHWGELLADLQAEVARLESFEDPGSEEVSDEATRKRLGLRGSFHLSLRRLPEPRRRDFARLGVLPEDVALTPAMAATLWDTDVRTARTSLRYLRDKALLLSGRPSARWGSYLRSPRPGARHGPSPADRPCGAGSTGRRAGAGPELARRSCLPPGAVSDPHSGRLLAHPAR